MENLVVIAILATLAVIFLSRKAGVTEIDPLLNEKTDDGAVVVRKFTPSTLYKYNGFDTEQIYIAVRGTVYDVSKSRQFYGPSGPYNNFAGHDASRGLALNSFEMDVIRGIGEPIDTLEDLTPEDVKSLDGWEEMFRSKYPVVGTLVTEGEA